MSSSVSWDLQVDPSVFKALKKFPRKDAEAILHVIRLLPMNPYFGDIRKMEGEENTWRRRVGSFRIFYKIRVFDKVILVFYVERRASRTY